MKRIITKRIYDDPTDQDGYRLLIDRVWPRGVSKKDAELDEWNKELAPSTDLRKWFDHKPERFEEFTKRYKKELKNKESELKQVKQIAQQQQICLLYGAKDEKHNQAIVLKTVLENL
ncbi:MAG TPA: DUF488 family protein [Flavobacteriaceae bacterium]|nr:DUF488 family protein [Flavobacteriaceae bacterium]